VKPTVFERKAGLSDTVADELDVEQGSFGGWGQEEANASDSLRAGSSGPELPSLTQLSSLLVGPTVLLNGEDGDAETG
jgi:hypothetical protein